VLEWPIHEFTFLDPDKLAETSPAEKKDYVEKYWQALKPEYRDGGAAESFVDFWDRVQTFRKAVEKLVPGALVFSHGQFMKMMQLQEIYDRPKKEAMAVFHDLETLFKIANTTRIAILANGKIGKTKVSHLPENLITY
jgi:broad specificity phosphatase PhoE